MDDDGQNRPESNWGSGGRWFESSRPDHHSPSVRSVGTTASAMPLDACRPRASRVESSRGRSRVVFTSLDRVLDHSLTFGSFGRDDGLAMPLDACRPRASRVESSRGRSSRCFHCARPRFATIPSPSVRSVGTTASAKPLDAVGALIAPSRALYFASTGRAFRSAFDPGCCASGGKFIRRIRTCHRASACRRSRRGSVLM
jgi:hypothetical protein